MKDLGTAMEHQIPVFNVSVPLTIFRPICTTNFTQFILKSRVIDQKRAIPKNWAHRTLVWRLR